MCQQKKVHNIIQVLINLYFFYININFAKYKNNNEQWIL